MSRDTLNKILSLCRQNIVLVLSFLLIVSSSLTVYFYNELSDLRENPQKAVQAETKRMLDKISELIVLPDDEQPTIATVSDPDQLKDNPFFAKAKKGFKVLIYSNASKSILYDPFENRVVETASMNVGAKTAPTPILSPSIAPKKK